MNTVTFSFMILTLVLLVAVLALGLFSMVKGGQFASTYGNKIMRYRIYLQALAIGLFLLTLALSSSS